MAPINLLSLSPKEKEEFIDSFDTILTDCDGVIWNPNGVINNAPQAVEELCNLGKTVHYITNNSTKTRAQLVNKLKELSFVNVTEDSVINTAGLAADYLRDKLPSGKVVYVVGSLAMSEELCKCNVQCFGTGEEDDVIEDILENISTVEIEHRNDVGAVLVGFDVFINYLKILKAATYLRNENCMFIATNTDETIPFTNEYVLPEAGAIVAPIQLTSGREPFVLGKPSSYLSEMLKKKFNPQRTLFIGDRMNTDILTGKKCSFKTLLVLSGVHSLHDVEQFSRSTNPDEQMSVPDYYTHTFADLVAE